MIRGDHAKRSDDLCSRVSAGEAVFIPWSKKSGYGKVSSRGLVSMPVFFPREASRSRFTLPRLTLTCSRVTAYAHMRDAWCDV